MLKTEVEFLIEIHNSICKKPYLYGSPEVVRELSKHLIHIRLLANNLDWNYEATEALWNNTVQQIYNTNYLPLGKYESASFRQLKWGENEKETNFKILKIYQDLWRELKENLPSNNFYPHISAWVASSLYNDKWVFAYSPDMIAMIFRNLMGFALDDIGYQYFLKQYTYTCQIYKGGETSKGLQDFNVLPSWKPEPSPLVKVLEKDYELVVTVVQQILKQLPEN